MMSTGSSPGWFKSRLEAAPTKGCGKGSATSRFRRFKTASPMSAFIIPVKDEKLRSCRSGILPRGEQSRLEAAPTTEHGVI